MDSAPFSPFLTLRAAQPRRLLLPLRMRQRYLFEDDEGTEASALLDWELIPARIPYNGR
ncbi:hypothetical protein GCWU000341_02138 [Oribacterium sp. oral taxon 078 str. F0262]|nr:hypothetical protein GCWU000341_02138 [Oribacterium sp. oral taxon 078 str. F0262]